MSRKSKKCMMSPENTECECRECGLMGYRYMEIMEFGKYPTKTLFELLNEEPAYVNWVIENVKEKIIDNGILPQNGFKIVGEKQASKRNTLKNIMEWEEKKSKMRGLSCYDFRQAFMEYTKKIDE